MQMRALFNRTLPFFKKYRNNLSTATLTTNAANANSSNSDFEEYKQYLVRELANAGSGIFMHPHPNRNTWIEIIHESTSFDALRKAIKEGKLPKLPISEEEQRISKLHAYLFRLYRDYLWEGYHPVMKTKNVTLVVAIRSCETPNDVLKYVAKGVFPTPRGVNLKAELEEFEPKNNNDKVNTPRR